MKFDQPFRVKLLQIGDSGAGKTTSIASVVNAGYRVPVIDFDNNMRIVQSYLDKPENASKISRIPINPNDDDKIGKKSRSSEKLMKVLTSDWIDPDTQENWGKIPTWGLDTVLFLDTATYMGKMFMRDALLRYKGDKNPNGYDPDAAANFDQTVYNLAQQKFNAVVKFLSSDDIKCNVVLNMHLKYSEEQGTGMTRGYPDTGVGKALGPSLGKDFTDVWRIDDKNNKKFYRTQGDHRMSLKNSAPKIIAIEEEFDLGKALNKLLGK